MNLVQEAKQEIAKDNFAKAAEHLCHYLDSNFLEDDEEAVQAAFLLGYCLLREDSVGLSFIVTKWAAEKRPGNPAAWHNLGKACHERQKDKEAQEFFRRAIKAQPNFPHSLEGLALSSLNNAKFEDAISFANRALVENHDALESKTNRGMAYLALRRWREGWRDYNENIGKEKNRKEMRYGDEPRWDGTKGQNIVVYGEQGIGDEISFGSVLPDLIRDCKSVTIESDMRLRNLFQRSFPTTEVYGTRYKDDSKREGVKARKYDARVAMGELPFYYRNRDQDFPGTPYLTPRPEFVTQFRALLDSLGNKPKIGISWTGGIPKTGQARRSVTLDTYAPLFKGFDADWISLQYKETEVAEAEAKYGIKIHDWDQIRLGDYDHSAALISQLDLVISVCTTVVHAAGGLGKETWCLVPEVPMWRYMDRGDTFPWAASVQLFRQKGREWPIHLLLGRLKDRFGDRKKQDREVKGLRQEVAESQPGEVQSLQAAVG